MVTEGRILFTRNQKIQKVMLHQREVASPQKGNRCQAEGRPSAEFKCGPPDVQTRPLWFLRTGCLVGHQGGDPC